MFVEKRTETHSKSVMLITRVKSDWAEQIENLCAAMNCSQSEFVRRAIKASQEGCKDIDEYIAKLERHKQPKRVVNNRPKGADQ